MRTGENKHFRDRNIIVKCCPRHVSFATIMFQRAARKFRAFSSGRALRRNDLPPTAVRSDDGVARGVKVDRGEKKNRCKYRRCYVFVCFSSVFGFLFGHAVSSCSHQSSSSSPSIPLQTETGPAHIDSELVGGQLERTPANSSSKPSFLLILNLPGFYSSFLGKNGLRTIIRR